MQYTIQNKGWNVSFWHIIHFLSFEYLVNDLSILCKQARFAKKNGIRNSRIVTKVNSGVFS